MLNEKINRGIWVMDVETIASCFTYCAINIDTEEVVKYVIHKNEDNFHNLINHLKECKGQIGFNNINFDYPIIHFILQDYNKWILLDLNRIQIINLIYDKSQELINNQSQFESGIKESEILIKQLDLFKLHHFNNLARNQSLKGLEIAMNYSNVMDMPIHHSKNDVKLEEINEILEYNLNDVLATYEFYKLSKGKIDLRKDLNIKYNLNCDNYPDSKIGEQLVLKLYCEASELNIWDIKKLRTKRESIVLKDCIFDYIKFQSKEFNKLLNTFNSKIITETKGSIAESVIYKGFKYDFGLGGIHGCIKEGVYESNNKYIIIDCDVSSLYPSIAVINKLFPDHLGYKFCDIYEDILKQRIAAKKIGNMTISDGFKLSLNSVYGKSNDEYSFLYDPLYTMKTTLNGQLMLAMLAEELVDSCGNFITILQINTDGITVRLHRDLLDQYNNVCKGWEWDTKLTLEYVEYSKMVIRDVNNYLAVTTKGKVKYKGAFEIEKELHKDNSFKIIPIALSEYFVNNIPIEQTIKNHKNIYDFCGRQKFKGKDYGETHELYYDENNLAIDKIIKQQKNVRYYLSNKGFNFIKKYAKGSTEFIHKGLNVTIFNKYELKDDYNINYNFYIKETQKELDNIITNQLELF